MSNAPHILLSGNTDIGLQYVGYAKTKLAALKRLGLPFLSRTFEIDSVEILIKITPQYDRIFITASYQHYVSGFLDTFQILPPMQIDISGNPIPINPAQYTLQDTEEQRTLIVPPATAPVPKMFGIRTTTLPSILTLTHALPVEPGAPPDQSKIQFREVFEHFLPSKFTGLMRGVMQIAFATFQWTSLAQVKVDYHFGNSYGVIQNPETKGYYLLRITADSVYYVPATFRVSIAGIAPNIQDVIQLISLDNTKAVKIGAIPADIGASWSNEIGWAFSYTLPEASIVYASTQSLGNAAYIATELLKLEFVFDSTTHLPISANLVRGSKQIFWNNHSTIETPALAGWGLFNIPQFGIPYLETGPARVYSESVDFGSDPPYPSSRPMPVGYKVEGIPVYVYYTKTGIKICTYSYTYFASQTNPGSTDLLANVMRNGGWTGTKTRTAYIQYGFSCAGSAMPSSAGGKGDSYTEYHVLGSGGTNQNLGSHRDLYPSCDAKTPANPGVGYSFDYTVLGVPYAPAYITDVEAVPITASGGGTANDMSLTLSTTDRECVIICSKGTIAAATYIEGARTVGEEFHPTDHDQFVLSTSPGVYYKVDSYDADVAMYQLDSVEPGGNPWTAFNVKSVIIDYPPFDDSYTSFAASMQSKIGLDPSQTGPTILAQTSQTINTSAQDVGLTIVCYSGDGILPLVAANFAPNNLMFSIHPYPQLFDFKSTSAAFNPENVAYQTTPGSIGTPIVKFNGIQYPVEHKLYGWIGLV